MLMLNFIYTYTCVIFSSYLRDCGMYICDTLSYCVSLSCVAGSDLVDWLFTHVDGFADRRDARKYACNLLKAGFIRHTVNKITFSEQCYYIFGDIYGSKYTFVNSEMYFWTLMF